MIIQVRCTNVFEAVCRDISKFQEKWVSRLGVNPCISLIRASLQHLNDAFKWRAIGIIIISSVSHSFVPSVFLNFRSESDNFHQPSTYKCVSPDLNWWRLSSHLQITSETSLFTIRLWTRIVLTNYPLVKVTNQQAP